MNETGRAIINDINVLSKKSTCGNYISVSSLKQIIRKYFREEITDVVIKQMVSKHYILFSKSNKAIVLSKGLQDDFEPTYSDNRYECAKYIERVAPQAVENHKIFSKEDWVKTYGIGLVPSFNNDKCRNNVSFDEYISIIINSDVFNTLVSMYVDAL